MTETTHPKSGTITARLSEVQALVTEGLKALERQADSLREVRHEGALAAVLHGQRSLHRQEAALRARLESFGGNDTTAPMKEAGAALAGVAARLMDAVRPSGMVSSLRDDAALFSGLGVAYLLLYITASGLADADTAALAQEGYEEAARLVMHVDSILPQLMLDELREANVNVTDVTERVKAMVMKAWERA